MLPADIRMQLSEQTRVLEARAEATAGVAGELHDYCRRRADLEHDYARALDKLARAAAQRHKDQKHKYAHCPDLSLHMYTNKCILSQIIQPLTKCRRS